MKTFARIARPVLAAALIAGISAPAFAEKVKLVHDKKTDTFCYKAQATGSRLAKKVCLTRDEIAARGIAAPEQKATALARK